MDPNGWARSTAARRNNRPPRETRRERSWKKIYRAGLVARGLTAEEAEGFDPGTAFLDYDPDDCAADEIYYMAQDADPIADHEDRLNRNF